MRRTTIPGSARNALKNNNANSKRTIASVAEKPHGDGITGTKSGSMKSVDGSMPSNSDGRIGVDMSELTDRQREILEFILAHQRMVYPTLREIAKHFNIALGTTQDHIIALRRKGQLPDYRTKKGY